MMELIVRSLSPAAMAAILAMLILPACSGGENRQALYLAQAHKHMDAGDYTSARIDVSNALQINVDSAEGRYLLALLEEREKNWKAVFGNLKAAVELDPTHVEATIKFGQMNLLVNQVDAARHLAEKALALGPENTDALALMASVALREEDEVRAEEYALKTLALDPGQETAVAVMVKRYGRDDPNQALAIIDTGIQANPDSMALRILRIRVLESLGRGDDVIAQYQALIAKYPDESEYRMNLAGYYIQKQRLDDAEALLRQALAARPDDLDAKLRLVGFLMRYRSTGDAIRELEAMQAAAPENFKLRNALGESYVQVQHYDKAKALYQGAFDYDKKGPASLAARNKLAELALLEEDTAGAQRWLDEVLKIAPKNPAALITRSRIKLREGDYQEAIPDLRVVLHSQPDSIPALLLLAEAQDKDGAASLALNNYQKVLTLQATNAVALYHSARLLAAQAQHDQAAENLEKLLDQQPNNVEAIDLLARVYSRLERWDDALALVQRLGDDEQTSARGTLMEGGLALLQGNNEEAATLARRALEQDAELEAAVPLVAQAYARSGDIEGAIDYVQGYLAEHPASGQAYDQLARLHLANEDSSQAIDAYKKALDVAPTEIGSYINLARLYRHQGRNQEQDDKVEALFLKGIEANPRTIVLRSELGVFYKLKGRYDEALAVLEQAYQIDSQSTATANNLAGLLIDHYPSGKNLRRAQELSLGFDSAEQPALLDTVGWLQYQLGNLPQAISLLQAAQAKGGVGSEYWYHLGMAYAADGQRARAKELLAMALEDEEAEFYGREQAAKTLKGL